MLVANRVVVFALSVLELVAQPDGGIVVAIVEEALWGFVRCLACHD